MGEKLRFAPVFYTLAQFKFNPIAQMSQYVPELQEQLRRMGYPDFRQESMLAIDIRRTEDSQPEVRNTEQKRWSFINVKSTEGYILLSDALIFHTTKYDSFDAFSKKAVDGLSLIHNTIDLAYLDRIGLRYLDLIKPSEEETIDNYLASTLLGLSSIACGKLNHSFSETSLLVDGGTLISRSLISDGDLAIPPDLMPLKLKLPEWVSPLTGRSVVLDFDYFAIRRIEEMNFDHIKNQLLVSHNIIENTFKASLTDYAFEVWR